MQGQDDRIMNLQDLKKETKDKRYEAVKKLISTDPGLEFIQSDLYGLVYGTVEVLGDKFESLLCAIKLEEGETLEETHHRVCWTDGGKSGCQCGYWVVERLLGSADNQSTCEG